MAERIGLILGFDPGGRNQFGWSVCTTDGEGLSKVKRGQGCADNAQEAFEAVQGRIEELRSEEGASLGVLAAGIDSPLLWGQKGNRKLDEDIRKALKKAQKRQRFWPKKRARVLAVNSLWGAVLVQGVLLGKCLHDKYGPDLQITETHPKALLQLLKGEADGKILDSLIDGIKNEHVRDATVSAFAAWKKQKKADGDGWKDLYKLHCDLGDPPLDVPSTYWMPIKLFDTN